MEKENTLGASFESRPVTQADLDLNPTLRKEHKLGDMANFPILPTKLETIKDLVSTIKTLSDDDMVIVNEHLQIDKVKWAVKPADPQCPQGETWNGTKCVPNI